MKDVKILIDTDIGDEIDDAWALYLAMRKGLDIVGVTTVFQNTHERARIAKRLMKLYGNGYESVPVYAGCGTPLGEGEREYGHTCHYTEELDGAEYAPDGDRAVDFIIEQCKKHGKDLTVIAIGPFTNIARAIEKDPSALAMAGKVVIMGGAYYKQYADWNVMCDVEAADVMFSSLSNLECIGADVTHRLPLTKDQLELLCNGGRDDAACELASLTRLWKKANPERLPALHDPLAVQYAITPEICKTEEHQICVITIGAARGLTLNVDKYDKAYMNPSIKAKKMPEATVACDVDLGFIDTFVSLFK